jgi:hypothetical protein
MVRLFSALSAGVVFDLDDRHALIIHAQEPLS